MGALAGRREPERSCVSCRRVRPRAELVRIVRTPEGAVAVDSRGSLPGRGAYVCIGAGCGAGALRRLRGALRVAEIDLDRVRSDLRDMGVA